MAGDSWYKPIKDKASDWWASNPGRRGLKSTVSAPYRVGSGEGLFGGRPAEWLGKFLRWVFGIFIILAFVLFLVFLYRSYSTGFAGTVTEEGLVAVEETGTPIGAKTGILDFFDIIFNPSSSKLGNQFVWESEVVENEYNEDLGVKISDLKETSSYYFSYDPIQLVGEVEALSLEDTTLKYSCELEDYEGVARVDPEEYAVYKQSGKEVTTVSCYFDNGFDTEKDEESRTAKLKVAYDFTTKAFLKIYFLKQEALNDFRKRDKDPFENINDPNLIRSSSTTQGRSTEGPMRIDLGIPQSQPLTERENRHLNVELVRRTAWSGGLKEMQNLELHLPPIMVLNENPNYCDFENIGEVDETGFSIYRISDSSLRNKVNVDCSKNFLANLGYSLTEDECRERFKDKITLGCDFRVLDLYSEGDMFFSGVSVVANYIYETEKKEVVTVFKREGLGIDICKDLDKNACVNTNRCKPLYGTTRDEYLGCEACTESFRYCTNYDGRPLCEDDPCKVGPCKFEDNSCKSASSV